ncbi:mitogen-activated protein kinase kinase kinase 7 [Gigaspora margarita]|uniref:Mitogen-activated protein kinase kinase kinase 7 n=1 Tax=Gigaspora margarita TaxID=4874 RepID=A0A8H3XH53_GIGMA|nr:mitogen-activated protein kinase kinase kinase 7 [Gigaspora margarita]
MEHTSKNEDELIKTSNKSNNEDIKFIKTIQSDNIKSISYSEIKNTKLIKIMYYGITVRGLWRNNLVIMKHISNELKHREIEVLKQLLRKLATIKHSNILEFLGISVGHEISNSYILGSWV